MALVVQSEHTPSSSPYHILRTAFPYRIRLIDKAESPPLSRSTSPISTADGAPEKVVIDPSKGGAVNPKAAEQSKALQVLPGCWPWEGLVKILQVDLYHPAWEARHGSAMALREILKTQGHAGGMKGKSLLRFNHTEY